MTPREADAPPLFTDVADDILAADEGALHSAQDVLKGAWAAYLRRLLPAVGGEMVA